MKVDFETIKTGEEANDSIILQEEFSHKSFAKRRRRRRTEEEEEEEEPDQRKHSEGRRTGK